MGPRRAKWLPAALLLVLLLALAAAWKWTGLRELLDVERIAEVVSPYRKSWFALPATLLVFVVAELVLFPVLVLIFACGIVFGPWLGAVYALLGALVSSMPPFWLGRKLGREKVSRWGGVMAQKVERVLERRGVIAVFLVRKIPAPFTLVNVVCGASSVTWRDFVLGTVLGMGTGVVLITILGGQLFDLAREADPLKIAIGVGLLFVPLLVALVVQRAINKRIDRVGGT